MHNSTSFEETYLYEYSSIPYAETTLLLLNPSIHTDIPFLPDFTGESGPIVELDNIVQESAPLALIGIVEVELDNIVQESAPLALIGIVEALLELLFPIWDLLL
ncbi:hypothetical protein V6Z11_D12G225200 [Gossypium hirsutum]